jgi:signal transduction histidine kinase
MRRLYLHVYLSFLGVLLLFAVMVGLAWHHGPFDLHSREPTFAGMAALAAELLPTGRPAAEHEATLRRVAGSLDIDAALWSADGTAVAAVGGPLPFPRGRTGSGWMGARGGPTFALRLPDARWLVVRHPAHGRSRPLGALVVVGALALAVAVGAYPLVRRLTRRLERLRAGVEELGGGDLRARVPVEGRDEVAALATSFNRAADRIEALLRAQRTLLASASHELRTPLTRIRMALELEPSARPETRARLESDIAELDALIGELLLASRLETVEHLEHLEELDLLGLAAEEGARAGVEVSGEAAMVRGDARLVRRLVRNLIENAQRHGAAPVEVSVEARGGRAWLRVCDRGPGVAEEERERIFEPFYRPPGRPTGDAGVGLGLALVRQIARRHSGDARCLTRPGGGTCLEVDLPSLDPPRPAAG